MPAKKGPGVFCAEHPKGRSGPSTALWAALSLSKGGKRLPSPFGAPELKP